MRHISKFLGLIAKSLLMVFVGVGLLWSAPADAEEISIIVKMSCGTPKEIDDWLVGDLLMKRKFQGITFDTETIFKVMAENEGDAKWALVVELASGRVCVFMMGENWIATITNPDANQDVGDGI